MEIRCVKCGGLACGLTMPDLSMSKAERFALSKAVGALTGEDAAPVINAVLQPTPDGIRDGFAVTCAACLGDFTANRAKLEVSNGV